MSEAARTVAAFAKEALRAETLTVPGRVNMFGLFIFFVAVLATGVLDLLEAVVRLWDAEYTVGPPLLAVLAVFALMLLVCVAILSIWPPKNDAR